MTTNQKWILGLALATIAGLLIYFNWDKIKTWKIFGGTSTPEKTDLEKCQEANKSKADGEACTNCVTQESGITVFNGKIVNGECRPVPQQAPQPALKKYVVSNTSGATVYTLQQGNFVAPRIPNTVPYGTQIAILNVSTDRQYVNTSFGWLSLRDIGVVS